MPTPSEPAESPFANFTDDQLLELKNDLEQRLSRFQRAFFEQHGRNPNEAERAPAKPAIRRYRAVCKELSQREEDHAKQAVRGADTGATGAVAEQGAQQAQVDVIEQAQQDAASRGRRAPMPPFLLPDNVLSKFPEGWLRLEALARDVRDRSRPRVLGRERDARQRRSRAGRDERGRRKRWQKRNDGRRDAARVPRFGQRFGTYLRGGAVARGEAPGLQARGDRRRDAGLTRVNGHLDDDGGGGGEGHGGRACVGKWRAPGRFDREKIRNDDALTSDRSHF